MDPVEEARHVERRESKILHRAVDERCLRDHMLLYNKYPTVSSMAPHKDAPDQMAGYVSMIRVGTSSPEYEGWQVSRIVNLSWSMASQELYRQM
jgi:hypothetical protein